LAAGFSTSATAAELKGLIMGAKCPKIASVKGDADCATKCIKLALQRSCLPTA
jgi:hypothetical protein